MNKETEIISILNKYQSKSKPLHDEGVLDPMDFYKVAKDVAKLFSISDVRQRSIVVISLDIEDFKLWKSENKIKEDGTGTQRKFKTGNDTYYCITEVSDLCSLGIDEIIETKHAKENKEYVQIRLVACCGNLYNESILRQGTNNQDTANIPKPPLCRVLREGAGHFCTNCGSTSSRTGFLHIFGERLCDNKDCPNSKSKYLKH